MFLCVNSPGGNAIAALRIYARAKEWTASGRPLIAHIQRAASGASVVALAADYRVLDLGGHLAVHDVSGGTLGERATAQGAFEAIYCAETFLPGDVVQGYMAREGWVTAGRDSFREGWIDEVGDFADASRIAVAVAAGGEFPDSPRRRRVRIAVDSAEAERIVAGLWKTGEIEMVNL